MKKVTVLFIFSFFMTHIVSASANERLVFGVVQENFDQLVSAEIIKVVYQKIGISVDFVKLPGKRSLKESDQGRIDGEVSRVSEVGDEYSNLIKVSTPITFIEATVFSARHFFDITSCEALKHYQIAIVRGLKHAELCTKGIKGVNVVNHLVKAFELLEANRVDLVITSKINGLYLSQKMGLSSIKPLTPSLAKLPVYHFINRQHADLVPKINEVLLAMQANQELLKLRQQIIERLKNDQQLTIYKI